VDHSNARSNGGTDRCPNLKPACIDCNLDKSNKTTRTARRWNGKTRAPLSREKRKQAKTENAILGALGGGVVGFAVGGRLVRWLERWLVDVWPGRQTPTNDQVSEYPSQGLTITE